MVQDGWTALMYASCKGHTAIVQALLADARVEVNLQDKVCFLEKTVIVGSIVVVRY